MTIPTRQRLPLDGSWEFRAPRRFSEWLPATVPGCVHVDLRCNGCIDDPFWGCNELKLDWIERTDFVYRKSFQVDSELLSFEHVELVAEGLDTVTEIRLNESLVGRTENMFVEFRFDAKPWLLPGGNLLEILFLNAHDYIAGRLRKNHFREWNDPVGGCSLMRKQQSSFGWDWGPRLPTCGIYRSIYLEGWGRARLAGLTVSQDQADELLMKPWIEGGVHFRDKVLFTLLFDGQVVAQTRSRAMRLKDPEVWWPNGLGAQPLYTLVAELLDGQRPVDRIEKRVGFRTVRLECRRDQWGQSFCFVVNGRRVFAKGANWIPAHSFPTEATPATYRFLLLSAKRANMNMIRVWGGGIYETDLFYDLCDELGLLVWQDFMFACSLYPGREYSSLYAPEFTHQQRRLEHHPALSLWCGNNEIEMIPELNLSPMRHAKYSFVFRKLIPDILRRGGSRLPYWPSSPHKPIRYARGSGKDSGDTHDWSVWHEMRPPEYFRTTNHRFVSEFGMQSYPHPEVALSFCDPEDLNVFSRSMENHQKHLGGNTKILEYLAQRYPFPRNYTALSYLSQVQQAYAIRSGVEHWRTSMPRCSGTLFWQLNDCWPVASWSSIDFGGRWKALQYDARRFFAPVLVAAKVKGQIIAGKGNYYENTISRAEILVASDLLEQLEFELRLTIFHVNRSEVLAETVQPDGVGYGEVTRVLSIDLSELIKTHGAANLLLRLAVTREQEVLSENTVLCDLPKFIPWQKARIEVSIEPRSRRKFRINLKAALPQYQVFLDLPSVKHELTDNFFEVWPDQVRSTELNLDCDLEVDEIRRRLTTFSIADSAM